ncbi:spermidine/putrescine ABC transporter substrate-binding protein [Paramicrobacterium chengjingii]|uniref:spermidine/putrescine ABC transporter substrate-binding protein n=1 Tax=Paramicrobacterium chengjingii TaxID=2769067 RepID=UPI0014222B5E|nr:spermidine/putrescine ABC transporter substrate-binding protein [Microbacterium chengjingii]
MERTLEAKVGSAVDTWIAWLPRWKPATHRVRTRLCRRCLGSPFLKAIGLDADVPHGVQHGLTTRMKSLIDDVVDEYTEKNLPLLSRELRAAERRKARDYRPDIGLDPEFDGLQLDPDPVPGEPFLFTLGELAEGGDVPESVRPVELSDEEKQALRTEIQLADECADHAGRLICQFLQPHRVRAREAVAAIVEPQVNALLDALSESLDAPPTRW